MKMVQTLIIWVTLITLLSSSLEASIFAEGSEEIVGMHSLEELPSYYMNPNEIEASHHEVSASITGEEPTLSIMSLMSDRSTYAAANMKELIVSLMPNLDAPDGEMKEFSIVRSTRMRNTVAGMEKNSIETRLTSDTLIHEKNQNTINPSTIGIHPISPINREKAVKKIMEKMRK